MSLFDKSLFAYSIYVFGHAFFVMLTTFLYEGLNFCDGGAPFSLFYGPFYFMMVYTAVHNKIRKSVLLIHLLPGVLALPVYIFLLLFEELEGYQKSYLDILYSVACLSMLAYAVAVWLVLQSKKIELKQLKQLIFNLLLTLCLVGVIFISDIISEYIFNAPVAPEDFESMRIIVYLVMLCSSLCVLQYYHRLSPVIDSEAQKEILPAGKAQENISRPKYETLKLEEEVLDTYEKKVLKSMETDKLYIDAALSLPVLAKKLRIPSHHLSQLFSLRFEKNFNTFISEYRVQSFCDELKKRSDSSIEEVFLQCGFNSKSSFNRQFKAIKNMTPSEFKKTITGA